MMATTTQTFWIETMSGTRVDLPVPRADQVKIDDIAYSLAGQCRFNGHCRQWYSVAEHSVHVSECLRRHGAQPRLRLLGLLHDAAEAYIGDVVSPVKALLVPAFRELENQVHGAILEALRIMYPSWWEQSRIGRADQMLLATEAFYLMPSRGVAWGLRAQPDPAFVLAPPWSAGKAYKVFLDTYRELRPEGASGTPFTRKCPSGPRREGAGA